MVKYSSTTYYIGYGLHLMSSMASIAWHISLPLMNSYEKTRACCFSHSGQAMFPETFSFLRLLVMIRNC